MRSIQASLNESWAGRRCRASKPLCAKRLIGILQTGRGGCLSARVRMQASGLDEPKDSWHKAAALQGRALPTQKGDANGLRRAPAAESGRPRNDTLRSFRRVTPDYGNLVAGRPSRRHFLAKLRECSNTAAEGDAAARGEHNGHGHK